MKTFSKEYLVPIKFLPWLFGCLYHLSVYIFVRQPG